MQSRRLNVVVNNHKRNYPELPYTWTNCTKCIPDKSYWPKFFLTKLVEIFSTNFILISVLNLFLQICNNSNSKVIIVPFADFEAKRAANENVSHKYYIQNSILHPSPWSSLFAQNKLSLLNTNLSGMLFYVLLSAKSYIKFVCFWEMTFKFRTFVMSSPFQRP